MHARIVCDLAVLLPLYVYCLQVISCVNNVVLQASYNLLIEDDTGNLIHVSLANISRLANFRTP